MKTPHPTRPHLRALCALALAWPLLSCTSAPVAPTAAVTPPGSALSADSRADFLKLIDRPRVPLDAELQATTEADGLITQHFTYATERGERVPGIWVRPAGLTGRRPVVIALHGTGGNKEGLTADLHGFAKAGMIGVAIDGRFHGERATEGPETYNNAIVRAWQTGRGHPLYYDTVWDVMRLVDWLATREEVDASRIGLFGISKGGIETYLAAAVDPRISAAAPCIAVQGFRWELDHDDWQTRVGTFQKAFDAVAKQAGVAQPKADFVEKFYNRILPGIAGEFDGPVMVTLIAPRPLLAINGDTDEHTPLASLEECAVAARAAYAQAGVPEKFAVRIEPHTGHAVTPESHQQVLDWFVRWLKP